MIRAILLMTLIASSAHAHIPVELLEGIPEAPPRRECPPPPAAKLRMMIPPVPNGWNDESVIEVEERPGFRNSPSGGSCTMWRARVVTDIDTGLSSEWAEHAEQDCVPLPEPGLGLGLAVGVGALAWRRKRVAVPVLMALALSGCFSKGEDIRTCQCHADSIGREIRRLDWLADTCVLTGGIEIDIRRAKCVPSPGNAGAE